MKNKSKKLIKHNIKVHNETASEYDLKHIEIYNHVEQDRIKNDLKYATSQIQTQSVIPTILDYGAGTGNITKHLLDLGAEVVASDISGEALNILKIKLENFKNLKTEILNGFDLSNFEDNTFDMVAAYSVIHHIPDYLKIIEEFLRVTKHGGIIFVDHEVCPAYWNEEAYYKDYLRELKNFNVKEKKSLKITKKITKLFSFNAWKKLIRSQLFHLNEEGDIHVYKNDHIEWDDIRATLNPYCEVVMEKDYLVCRERNETPLIWTKWKDLCVDIRLTIYRKI